MLKVGDFSKLAHVTIKTLRHYDSLGLLKPVHIDRYTGYRFYTISQLPRLQRILALKDLGFSLAQIGQMLDHELPPEALRRIFNEKQAELEKHLREEQGRLARVAERLQQIEQEGCLPAYAVTLKSIPALSIAALRQIVPSQADLPARASQMRAEVFSWVNTTNLRSRGQWLVLYHHPEYRETNLDVEVALALETGGQAPKRLHSERITLRELPAVERMACLLTEATKPVQVSRAYADLLTWVERSDYCLAGAARELLIADPTQPQNGSRFTEIQFPVESAEERKRKLIANPYRKEDEMEPKITSLPAFTVVGVRYYGNNKNNEIVSLWDEFNRRSSEICHITPGSPAYGVCGDEVSATAGEFEYVASFGVDSAEDVPAGMVVRQVPAHEYAVFTHVGSLDNLKATYEYIYKVWLPKSGRQRSKTPDFEAYGEDFKFGAPDSRFYIYVPIE